MNSIYDPITNKRHPFLSKKGLYILKQYIKEYQLGGSTIAERVKRRRNPEEAQTQTEEEGGGEEKSQIQTEEVGGGEGESRIGKYNREFLNNLEKEYQGERRKSNFLKENEYYRGLYDKYIMYTETEKDGVKLPKKIYRALRPRDLYWLFKKGNIEAPCIDCDDELMNNQECCKVSVPYHIQTGSKKTVLKGPWLSMTSDKNTAALWSGRKKYGGHYTFNVDPVLEANWDEIDNERIPTNGRSGIFVEINTQDLPLMNTKFFKKQTLGVTAFNNAKSAKEYLIENRIPGTHITKIFISNDTNDITEFQNYIDNPNSDNLGGIQKYRYKKDEIILYDPSMVIYKDDLSDSVGINYVEKKDELITMKELFDLCNKDKRFVKGQPWYEQQIVPLLEETDSIS